MAHRAACGLQHRVTEAVAGDVLFAVQQDKAHAVAAVRPQEAMGDVGHLLAFGHHVQIAHGAVAGDGLIEEALAVVAKDGPDTAEGEGRTAVDVGCLTCTGACLHGSACPQHHTDAGTVTAHGRNIVHVGAVLAVGPCQVAQGVAQVQTHVRVAAEVAGCHDDSIGIDLEVLAVDIGEDGTGNLAVLVHQGQTLCAVDVLAALFHGLLLQQTDERHPMTVPEMIAQLAQRGVSAERKSIYGDLEALRIFGLDIVQTKSKTTGYYVGTRAFETPELKLLVDSVQSSKFITHKKTLALIKKIEGLASIYDAQLLQRQVYVHGRVKSMNESVYYNVDEISDAISRDRQIRFHYFEYTISKQRRYRKEGAFYVVSPLALMWDNENYYLLAWDAKAALRKHYRVDKMTDISALEVPREGAADAAQLDLSAYSQKVFSMFSGEEQTVRLRFANHLVGAVLDRFGKDVIVVADGPEHFKVTLNVVTSPKFYAWLFGFGTEVEILSPPSARQEMQRMLTAAAQLYAADAQS